MSDIVEELRAGKDWCDGPIKGKAADEIDRLRCLVEECKHNHIMLTGEEYGEFIAALDGGKQ
jgi:hypothetical protein